MKATTDDDGWVRALAGQPADDAPPASALEARLLRGALLRTSDAAAAPLPPTPAEALDFLRRLERERAAGTCEGCAERGARLKAWWIGHWRPVVGAMATLTAAAIVVWALLPAPADPPVMRGGDPSAVQLRADAQPQLQRDDLARRLGALGATTRRYERLGRFGVDARFTMPLAPAAVRELQTLGLAVDADGVVRVEFEDSAR